MLYGMSRRAPFGYAGYGGPGFFGWFGESIPCPPVKLVNHGDVCGPPKDFCGRILGAINLSKRAAARLEAKPQTPATQVLFQQVFGQPTGTPWQVPGFPSRTVPAGDMVAQRFRMIANELQTRDTIYRCVAADRCTSMKSGGACGGGENYRLGHGLGRFHLVEREPLPDLRPNTVERPRPCHPTDTIIVDNVAMALLCRNEVWLCPPFWKMKPLWQEGTLIHEMSHLCFGVTCAWFQHDAKERKRNSAYCYEVFALGGPSLADPVSVSACNKTPL
jgi:hypothetical protein